MPASSSTVPNVTPSRVAKGGPTSTSPGRSTVPSAAKTAARSQSKPGAARLEPSWPSPRRTTSSPAGSSSSGVTTTGPRTSPKSTSFGGGQPRCPPLQAPGEPPERALLAHDGCQPSDGREVGGAPRHGIAGPDDRRGVGEDEHLPACEHAHGRRVRNGDQERDAGERVLGVLACVRTTGEEVLQRLRGEMDDPVTVDAADPAALQRLVVGVEHAEAHSCQR